jgi:hypothetical protein
MTERSIKAGPGYCGASAFVVRSPGPVPLPPPGHSWPVRTGAERLIHELRLLGKPSLIEPCLL